MIFLRSLTRGTYPRGSCKHAARATCVFACTTAVHEHTSRRRVDPAVPMRERTQIAISIYINVLHRKAATISQENSPGLAEEGRMGSTLFKIGVARRRDAGG